jgi:hypothetical protein
MDGEDVGMADRARRPRLDLEALQRPREDVRRKGGP